jgi:hypothetical protein
LDDVFVLPECPPIVVQVLFTETAAILDVAKRLDIIHEDKDQKGRELLIRIIMMLTKLAQKTD